MNNLILILLLLIKNTHYTLLYPLSCPFNVYNISNQFKSRSCTFLILFFGIEFFLAKKKQKVEKIIGVENVTILSPKVVSKPHLSRYYNSRVLLYSYWKYNDTWATKDYGNQPFQSFA